MKRIAVGSLFAAALFLCASRAAEALQTT